MEESGESADNNPAQAIHPSLQPVDIVPTEPQREAGTSHRNGAAIRYTAQVLVSQPVKQPLRWRLTGQFATVVHEALDGSAHDRHAADDSASVSAAAAWGWCLDSHSRGRLPA
jgi:hypothetical protein